VPETTTSKTANPITGFFAELKRRRVLQIGGAYVAGAWLGAEILSFLFEQFQAPDWSYRLLAIIFVVGFPISMVLAWLIQVRQDGSWAFDSSRGDAKTMAAAIVIGVLATLALSWLILPQREPPPIYEPLPASLAVFPFADPDATPHAKTAADTLYRSLMEGLEHSPELTLVRLGAGELPTDPVDFAKSLGVAGFASGQFANGAEGLLFEIQLLDVTTEVGIFAESYAWDTTRIPEIANMIANGLLQALGLPPLAAQKFIGTSDREAYTAYMAGQKRAALLEAGQLELAIADFQRALDLDPGYMLAHVGLAQAIYNLLDTAAVPQSNRQALEDRARRAVRLAQALDPDSADAISLLGLQLDNKQLRIQAWERALELDPDHAISYYRYAVDLREEGKLEEAERLIRRAITLSPQNARFRSELSAILGLQGRRAEANAELEKAKRL
jgi:tetratricopeptide (TPR) repeat protein